MRLFFANTLEVSAAQNMAGSPGSVYKLTVARKIVSIYKVRFFETIQPK